jgi:DNA-binding beta-propeller fold protein YncE
MQRTLAGLFSFALLSGAALGAQQAPVALAIPGGQAGLDLDDMAYVPALNRIVVPAGQTGSLLLINPADLSTSQIGGVIAPPTGGKAPEDAATTSVSYGQGDLFASSHAPMQVVVIDAHSGKVLQRTPLASEPDYVRYLAAPAEVWVTEPHAKQIQVFAFSSRPAITLKPVATIAVPGGPESLVFDPVRHRAYANLWGSQTVAIDLDRHALVAHWQNTCGGSRGLALDAAHAHLFVGCTEGKVVTLDVANGGKPIGSAEAGKGIDILSYSAAQHRLYVPAGKSANLTVFDVSTAGAMAPVATYPAAAHAHCVADDDNGTAFVCDPRAGKVLVYKTR